MQSGHQLLSGAVGHRRLQPKPHGFAYDVGYYWLDLRKLAILPSLSAKVAIDKFAAVSFRRADYLRDVAHAPTDLSSAVLELARKLLPTVTAPSSVQLELLALTDEQLDVQMLAPLANYGVFFSPLTMYFIGQKGQWHWMLAEVSNTPWNERHYYLVPLVADGLTDYSHAKNFHVSPFNPIEMIYRWKVQVFEQKLRVSITNFREERAVFSAWFDLQAEPLSESSLKNHLIRSPWQNVQIVIRIYWQALRLLIKGMPIYRHQKPKDPSQ
jgi:DUF1365 family protein